MVTRESKPFIFAVGAFAPPVNGLSNMNEAMSARLAAHARVVRFDTARAARAGSPWRRLTARIAMLLLVPRFAALALMRRPASIYIGFSGGPGQLIDGMFAAVGTCLAIPVFFHHHTFRYIVRPSRLTRAVLKLACNAKHVALCPQMAARLALVYPDSIRDAFVLPNAALIPRPPARLARSRGKQPLMLGFLSNITRAKGIFSFFALLDVLQRDGVSVRATIAGPVADEISAAFQEALLRCPDAQHIGPVSGPRKSAFLESIDILVFPSHEPEADPLTIAEATAAGVPVVASDKGCIAAALRQGAGVHFPDDEYMVANMARFIARTAASSELYESLSRAAADAAAHREHEQQAALGALLEQLMSRA
jgi:glycosyltransferase involved in cell wall biosynthesis